jgi:hypothetical protein
MAAILSLAARPGPTEDGHKKARYRAIGITVAVIGLMGTMVAAIGNFVAAAGIDTENSYSETLAWTFGLTIFSFGTMKFGIAIILMGIIVRLWFRVDALKHSLGRLHGHGEQAPTARGGITTPYGAATVTDEPPKLLPIHRMARVMWRPMLAMGVMLVTTGLVSSLVWASKTPGTEGFRQAAAFTQGIEFLGEAMLLSGIAFLLGTILAGLREGGGEVQSSLGIPVTTLKMSLNAKGFVALMMMGLMIGIAQFGGYLVAIGAADDPASFSSYLNWLGPFRELSLGLILAGIVLALVTISNVLAFQFDRVKSIIRNGY